ncbi:hypothetical protein [Heyndrickxia camelliae]|uniref:Lipoprotein n=1 Tax=Heyndrickxia camelliae TaxID=1707093 RepID=A0A2N3LKR5_9BACI|nr:hypothetical protein [Heyndrickxia camelliae]PKR85231.1 hypothetical protein CWO92_10795 [Heyndrickxia camelliae]
MKKILAIGITGLLALSLGACGDKTSSNESKEKPKNETSSKTINTKKEPNVTTDIFETVEKNITFQDENTGVYKILGEYLNGNTENGMYQIYFGDTKEQSFILNYSVKLSENPDGEKGLLFLEEGDNTKSGQLVDYSGTKINIITDTAEQIGDDIDHVTSEFSNAGVSYEGPVKEKGFMFIKFENQDKIPNKLDIDFDAPDLLQKDENGDLTTVAGDSDTGTKTLGKSEHVTLKLSKL